MSNFPLFPESASTIAGQIDAVYFALIAISLFFSVLIATLLTVFAIKYHRSRMVVRKRAGSGSAMLEVFLIGVPTVIGLALFYWSAGVYFHAVRPPADTMDIYVVGKQWMWKIMHPGGQSEINTLHVPMGQPVKLIMTSQDVIHSFYIPAFRVKQDVLPGRFTTLWFEATKTGEFHLFCAEYCGLDHSRMVGKVVVMTPADYEAWLARGGQDAGAISTAVGGGLAPLSQTGSGAFAQLGCNACHVPTSALRAPRLEGLFGKPVKLRDGTVVTADENYLRESILDPNAKIVAGYPTPTLMPTYQGQINADQLIELVAYIKSLGADDQGGEPGGQPSGQPGVEPGADVGTGTGAQNP